MIAMNSADQAQRQRVSQRRTLSFKDVLVSNLDPKDKTLFNKRGTPSTRSTPNTKSTATQTDVENFRNERVLSRMAFYKCKTTEELQREAPSERANINKGALDANKKSLSRMPFYNCETTEDLINTAPAEKPETPFQKVNAQDGAGAAPAGSCAVQ